MQESAYDAWIEALTELEFHEPFLSLLRAHGFYDIIFTHGPYEFGKDVSAKRRESGNTYQYGFQCKKGDIAGSVWEGIVGQLHELSGGRVNHASYDAELPRRSVLVLTGRLRGKAVPLSGSFKDGVAARGEGEFQVWDRERLVEMLAAPSLNNKSIGVSSSAAPVIGIARHAPISCLDLPDLLAVLADESASRSTLQQRSRDNSICAASFLSNGHPVHAYLACLNEFRNIALASFSNTDAAAQSAEPAFSLLNNVGQVVFGPLLEHVDDELGWLERSATFPASLIAYPILCSHVCEYLALLTLRAFEIGTPSVAKSWGALLADTISKQPGASTVVSDRQAASVGAVAAALHLTDQGDNLYDYIRKLTVSLCELVERELGPSDAFATPHEQIEQVLGARFDFTDSTQTGGDLMGFALAEAAKFFCPRIYEDVVNDLLAVGSHPSGTHAQDIPEALFNSGAGTQALISIKYPEEWTPELLPHHQLQSEMRTPERVVGVAGVLGIACLLRDRLFTDTFPRLVGNTTPYRSMLRQ